MCVFESVGYNIVCGLETKPYFCVVLCSDAAWLFPEGYFGCPDHPKVPHGCDFWPLGAEAGDGEMVGFFLSLGFRAFRASHCLRRPLGA